MADASKGETAASTQATKQSETKEEVQEEDDGNDFEKVMKTNYYDTAVDQPRVVLLKPIIRQKETPNNVAQEQIQLNINAHQTEQEQVAGIRSDRY